MPPKTDAVVVMTTVATADEAVALVRALLERRLVACGTVLPAARSLYRWEGKVADEHEVVVLLKTRATRVESLGAAFRELHPYKVPELLALPVAAGTEKYLGWIASETTLALA
jgi:periplasmic divalent cation tolerance protein